MQDNPFAQYAPQQPATPQGGPIYSPAPVEKPISAAEAERLRLAREAEARQQRGEQRQNTQAAISQRGAEIAEQKFTNETERKEKGFDATEGERKAAAFLVRALGSNQSYENAGVGPRSLVGQAVADTAPNFLNVLPGAIGNSPKRQVADSAQDEFIAASLRQDSGAAIPEEEMERQRRIYFPMPGDGDEVIEAKRQARLRAIQGLTQSAGRLKDQTLADWDKTNSASGVRMPTDRDIYQNGVEFNDQKWMRDDVFDRSQYLAEQGWGGGKEALMNGFMRANTGNPDITAADVQAFYEANGIPIPPDPSNFEFTAQSLRDGVENIGIDTSSERDFYVNQLDEGLDARGIRPEDYGDTIGAKIPQAFALGLGDELQGAVGAAGALLTGGNPVAAYGAERDMVRRQLERSEAANPKTSLASELVGGLASGVGFIKAPTSIASAARQGAAFGAVGGFGYGDGLGGSAVNALGGAALGGALGAAGQKVGNALANRAANRAAKRAASPELANANALASAGRAEGVTVNRAMIDPDSANAVTKTDATALGGPRMQAGMRQIEDQIEGRVAGLGGGRAMINTRGVVDDNALGSTALTASKRIIKETGDIAEKKYNRAIAISNGAKVEPKTSLTETDDIISKLSETSGINEAEITFLKKIREDLSKDLTVDALRRMRTTLRKKVNGGDLVFGESETRVLEIMDKAADDIRVGLTKQGKLKAARAFESADKSYRARMDYIENTIQPLIGKRNSNLSAEQVARKLQTLATKDEVGLRKFYASLTPDEAADVASTFAFDLGKNNKNDFTVTQFIRQSDNLSDSALRTLFGKRGAESIENLRIISKEVERVTGAMNSNTSKSGVGAYKDWLYSLALGGGAAFQTGAMTAGALTVGAGAATAGKQILSARALMSPNITKWILNAPNTSNPKAINAHFAKLGSIAKAEPALAGEIEVLRNAIIGAANDNAGRMSAVANEPEQQMPQE